MGCRNDILLSEHKAAWVMSSSQEVTLSSSMDVSSKRPLTWVKKSLRAPLVVTQRKALFPG